MQMRTHQAFAAAKAECWKQCQSLHAGPEQQGQRRRCVSQQCYKPAQEADRQRAASAGISYEQMQTPLLMRAVYGTFEPRFVVLLRNPADRCASMRLLTFFKI